jgi:hypothetical protein
LKQVSRNSSKRNGPIAINATSLRPNQTAAWNDAEALRNLQVVEVDPLLIPHVHHLRYRFQEFLRQRSAIDKHEGGLEVFSRGYEKFGFTREKNCIVYREWAPAAQ